MRHGWLLVVTCSSILLLGAQKTYAAFPQYFPTIDDSRVAFGSSFNPGIDDTDDNEPNVPLKITHMRVRSEIALRYARTAIVSNVYNPSKRAREATFQVLLPETAFISGFTMTIGKESYDAYVKEKEVAKQIYQEAVAQGVSAAHVATKARDSNHFTIKFNLEGRTNATYRLRYEEFLVRRNGVYNHAINLLPGALVPKMDVVIHIKESQKIKVLRVPELRSGNEIDATEKDAQYSKAVIQRGKNGREATITFTPDLAEQIRLAEIYADKIRKTSDPESSDIGYDSAENENEGMLGQFVVQYDVEKPKNGEILVNDGYFVHFFAPSSLPPIRKHVVFVLDTSSSMWGNKIEQLRKAMKAILSDLNPSDYFSIIEFNTNAHVHDLTEHEPLPLQDFIPTSSVKLLPPSPATPENIASAKKIVSTLTANGGTNIYDALEVALNLIQKNWTAVETQDNAANKSLIQNDKETDQNKNELEPLIIFLSDGAPTVGIISMDRIITYMTEKNSGEKRVPIYSLAFGNDADRLSLRKLSLRNEGFMRHIYEAADAALQLRDFYRQVSSPLLADLKFVYPRSQIKEGSLSKTQFRTINDGSEVAVVGRVAENINELTPQMYGFASNGEGQGLKRYEASVTAPVSRNKDEYLPLERLWAYLTIKQLLDKRDAGDVGHSDSKDDNPGKKALEIALKYSFVTALTSLVVVRLNKTDVMDQVDAETVDDPKYVSLLFAAASPPITVERLAYTGISTGTSLSLTTKHGPVLYAEATKRFNVGGHGGGYFDQQFLPPLMQHEYHMVSQGAAHSYGSSIFSYSSSVTNVSSPSNVSNQSSSKDSMSTATFPPYSFKKNLTELYHLEEYEWVLSFINDLENTISFTNSLGQVKLKVSRDINPPQSEAGDYECWPGEAAGSKRAGQRCVYLTRCAAARNFTFTDYKNNYCYVGDRYEYAGVCCPSNEIDKMP